jgi:hypothetical protein
MAIYVKLWAVAKKAEPFHCPTHADALQAQHLGSMMDHFTSPPIVPLWGPFLSAWPRMADDGLPYSNCISPNESFSCEPCSWRREARLELSTMDQSWTARCRPGKLVARPIRDGMWTERNCWGSLLATIFGGRQLFLGLLRWRGTMDGWSSSRRWLNLRGRREVMGVGVG